MRSDELTVLLAEDNRADVYLLQSAAHESQAPLKWIVAMHGREAWDYLEMSAGNHLPDLLILDLNLPELTGREILSKMERVPKLRKVPVAVFTSSEGEAGIADDFPEMQILFAVKTSSFLRLMQLLADFIAFARR